MVFDPDRGYNRRESCSASVLARLTWKGGQ